MIRKKGKTTNLKIKENYKPNIVVDMKKSINPDGLRRLKRRNLQIFSFGNLAFGFGDACVMIVIIPLYMELTGSEFITGLLITLFIIGMI